MFVHVRARAGKYIRVLAVTMLWPHLPFLFLDTGKATPPMAVNGKAWMQVLNRRKHFRVLKTSFGKTVFGQGVFTYIAG